MEWLNKLGCGVRHACRWVWSEPVRRVWTRILAAILVVLASPVWGVLWRILLYGDVASQGALIGVTWATVILTRLVRHLRQARREKRNDVA